MNANKCAKMMEDFSNDPIAVANRLRLKNSFCKIQYQVLEDEYIGKYEDNIAKIGESNLSEEEISDIYKSNFDHKTSLRKIANEAHKAAIKKICEMKPKTPFYLHEIKDIIANNENDIYMLQEKIIDQFLLDIKFSIEE